VREGWSRSIAGRELLLGNLPGWGPLALLSALPSSYCRYGGGLCVGDRVVQGGQGIRRRQSESPAISIGVEDLH
jgi:hypothetical protein